MQITKEESVLLIVDIQEKLAAAMPEKIMKKTIKNCQLLLEAARRMGIPVVVSEQYPKGLGPTVPELRESLDSMDDLSRVEKLDFSACAAEGFGEIAKRHKELGRKQWIVVGMETHICVFQTARALLAAGNEVHLPVDALVSRRTHNYQVGLGLAERCGAYLSSSETIVMDLLGRAEGEDFKAISRLIR